MSSVPRNWKMHADAFVRVKTSETQELMRSGKRNVGDTFLSLRSRL